MVHRGTARVLVSMLAAFAASGAAEEFRSVDGSGNNPFNPDMNAAGTQLRRSMAPAYFDGIAAMPLRPGPRETSNAVASQPGDTFDKGRRSDFLWQWGQFLDHDISLTRATSGEPAHIEIPLNDPFFAPGTFLSFDRSLYDAASGISDPRQQINEITGWIDASHVYGSDPATAAALRTGGGSGHRLTTSAGNLLPLDDDGAFLAGDVRVNEQIGLTALHTLFVREHNGLAESVRLFEPDLSDEETYQRARRLVGAMIQSITYNEFIPALLGNKALTPYRGYDPAVDARILNEFSTAAFRLGHSLLSGTLLRLDSRGREIASGHVALREAFFAPELIRQDGIEPNLRGLAAQVCQALDPFVIDDVRNFLFGLPGFGGADLVSFNIQRGRDHGLPTYNEARAAMGMKPAATFAEVSSRPEIRQRLESVYSHPDEIDLWVGGLAEDHVSGAMVGPLFFAILKEQFEALRDGDRFWYQIDLSPFELKLVEQSTLAEIIIRNTTIRRGEIQQRVFFVTGKGRP